MKKTLPLLIVICLVLFTTKLLHADYISLKKALKIAQENKLSLPKPGKNGRYQSFNKKGTATTEIDRIVSEFIDYASEGKKRVLHLDATFGHVTLKAMEKGIHEYIATDSDERHIAVIAKRLQNSAIKNKKSLKLYHGDFPESFKNFKSNSFDVVLLNRVIHFYTPKQLTKAMKEILRILKPGGRVFIISLTPYVKRYETFIPLYKQRLLLKHQYPGYVKNLKHFANPQVTTPEQMAHIYDKPFMFFDAQLTHTLLSEFGFIVEKVVEFPIIRYSPTWHLDGREYVGAIARKNHPRPPFPYHID